MKITTWLVPAALLMLSRPAVAVDAPGRELQQFVQAVEASSTFYVFQAAASAEAGTNSAQSSVTTGKGHPAAPVWAREPMLQHSIEFGKTSFAIRLFWNKDSDASAYNVYKSTTSGKDYTMVASVAENQFIDTAVEAGKTYYYMLTELDGAFRESGYSQERSVTVLAPKRPEAKKRLMVIPRPTTSLWKVLDKRRAGDEEGMDGLLGDAFDLAYDRQADLLYVSSTFNRRIVVLRGSDGAVLRQFGPRFGDHEIGVPLGLGLDAEGRLYVVDGKGHSVAVLTPDGGLVRLITVPKQDGGKEPRLIDVAVGPDGTAFVTDNANGRVIAIDRGGREIWRWVAAGGKDGRPAGVTKIAITAAGDLVVIDGQSQMLHLVSPSGNTLFSFGERKPSVGGFLFLSDVVPLDDGHLLAADLVPSSVREYMLQRDSGTYVANLANARGDANLFVLKPLAIAGDGKDLLFVLDDWGGRINAFRVGEIRGSQ